MEKANKLFSDFLYGGTFYNADDDLKTTSTARTCPSNNITVEQLIGKLESAIKQSPNSSVGAIETKVVYNNNKTQTWLDTKSNADKEILVKTAIKNTKQVTLDRIESKEKQPKRKSDTKASIEENNRGKWNLEIELETEIDKLRTKTEKMKALKTQINLYKDDQVLDISKIDTQINLYKDDQVLDISKIDKKRKTTLRSRTYHQFTKIDLPL
ncbi:unnamed protein product [Mytilus coruscus]|uniref:Uncharacterized protein n=1 Tax=Mytilus coruscus TaxID=42192 RepID=A0A6J8DKC7_MYTCO|nr:unnamed protein product [Mytilus coruscus]